MTVLSLDFETYAKRDLTKVGAYEYVACPDFEVTVIAWAFDDGPVCSRAYPYVELLPEDIRAHILQGGEVHAWNANFEHVILTQHYKLDVPFGQMVCTQQRARYFGLPAALVNAGPALGLPPNLCKDETMRPLMKAMGKPGRKGQKIHATDQVKLDLLKAYCEQDVVAERAIAAQINRLPDFERKVSLIDARSNSTGIMLDTSAIKKFIQARDVMKAEHAKEVMALTSNAIQRVATQHPALHRWLATQGVTMPLRPDKHGNDRPSTAADAVDEALALMSLPFAARRVLEIRQLASKSSLDKLDKMLVVQGPDGRARGQLQYYGASRTGRWAGRGFQPQNLPKNRHRTEFDQVLRLLGGLDMFYEKPLVTLSECLRGCIVASKGKLLAQIDLSQIEARVLCWLAGQNDVLELFRRGEDVYTIAAAKLGSSDRQLGKVATLGLGYKIGAQKFVIMAADYGVALTLEEAEHYRAMWIQQNPMIKKFWWDMLDEAKRALFTRPMKGTLRAGTVGGIRTVRKIQMLYRDGILRVRKPNGGILYYHRPRIMPATEEFWYDGGVDRWYPQKTYGGRLVENVTQSVARDIVAEAVVRIEEAMGLVPVMTVHDELVYEVGTKKEAGLIQKLVDTVPGWAAGLPIASTLHVGVRYGK